MGVKEVGIAREVAFRGDPDGNSGAISIICRQSHATNLNKI